MANRFSERVDYQTSDRKFIERLCRSDTLSQYVPNLIYFPPAPLDALKDDDGETESRAGESTTTKTTTTATESSASGGPALTFDAVQ